MADTRLSLCVGVTGHRDIPPDDRKAVEAAVREAFGRLKNELGCPMVVLSSLAEGADRIVARVALELDCPLVVPLPLAVEDYRTDFESAESKNEFGDLLARAEHSFVVEPQKNARPDPSRPAAYARAGALVARTCHVLLALWDGKESGKRGGTSDIVGLKRSGEGERKPHGVVIEIATPRQSTGGPEVELKWLAAKDHGWQRVQAMARRIRRFNEEAATLARTGADRIEQSRRYLYDGKAPDAVAQLSRIVDLYAIADALAIQRQAWVRRGWQILLALGLLSVLALGHYAEHHEPKHPTWFLAGYVVVLALAFGVYLWMRRHRIQQRFLEYRALAEALRVAFFWRLAGLSGEPTDHYPGHIVRAVESVVMSLRSEEIRVKRPPDSAENVAFAVKQWAEGQLAFFKRAAERHRRWDHRLKRSANLAIGLGIAVALITLGLEWTTGLGEDARHGLILAAVVLPTLGGVLATYTDRLGHESQAQQYERMIDQFELALDELRRRDGDIAMQRIVLARLAREALSEQAHWVVLHRQRPFEYRAGG